MEKGIEKLQRDFESYIKKFHQVQELAKRFNTNPGEITEFLFEVGVEALSRTENSMSYEFKYRSKKVFQFLKDFRELEQKVKNKITVDRD